MKRLAIAMAAMLCTAVTYAQSQPIVYDATPRNNVGIGVGTIIFNGQEGLLSQICAATTNGTFGNQTFAISSGTLGAEQPTTLVRTETLKIFVANNMDTLAQDIAVGEGEYLSTVVELLDIPAENQASFRQRARESFATIYGSEKVTHLDVLSALRDLSQS